MRGAPWRSESALVLAAHGSRGDQSCNAAIETRVGELGRLGFIGEATAAYHQGDPGFSEVLDRLSASRVVVVPFMASEGYYATQVLPAALKQNRRYPELEVRVTPPIGRHPGVAPLVARRIAELCREYDLPREQSAVVVLGHGTPRHPESRATTIALAHDLTRRALLAEVAVAFLDDEPSIDSVQCLTTRACTIVIPFLIGGGTHALADLPPRLGLACGAARPTFGRVGRRAIILDRAVGEYPELTGFVADLARRHLSPPGRVPLRSRRAPLPGRVALVGAGPGDPGLITVRGLTALREADVVLHDRLVSAQLLKECRPGAELIDVGKLPGGNPQTQEGINQDLVARARLGKRVVRLKGGDPFVFGRGAEEQAACLAEGIPCEVIPGVSSALAAPAAAGIPVTARGLATSFAVVTARSQGGEGLEPGQATALAALDTIVVLMGRSVLAQVARQLIEAGRSPETPAACIQNATLAEQRVVRGTLATIAAAADREGLISPVVTVVGEVAGPLPVGAT